MRKVTLFATICFVILTLTGCVEEAAQGESPVRNELTSSDLSRLKPLAVSIIDKSLASKQGMIRSHAIEVVAATGRRELMPVVVQLLEDESVAVRFAAAMAIGDTKYKPAENEVHKLLIDKNENAKIAAAYALMRLGQGSYDDMILQAMKSKDQTLRANAALLVGKLGDKKKLKSLHWVLNSQESGDMVRMQAVESIALLGDESIYQKLWAIMISKYVDDRIMGIRSMGALKTTEAKNSIITMLDDDVEEVRLAAAEQLGRMGDRTGVPEVKDYFKKSNSIMAGNSNIRADILASMAIGAIGDDRLAKYLPPLLKSRSAIIRLNAAQSVLMMSK